MGGGAGAGVVFGGRGRVAALVWVMHSGAQNHGDVLVSGGKPCWCRQRRCVWFCVFLVVMRK